MVLFLGSSLEIEQIGNLDLASTWFRQSTIWKSYWFFADTVDFMSVCLGVSLGASGLLNVAPSWRGQDVSVL